jgi:hypothetical protein
VPAEHREWRVCAKPFRGFELADMLTALLVGPAN